MHFSSIVGFALLSAIIPLTVGATPRAFTARMPAAGLEKRFDNARLTWYDITTGVTACGGKYSNNDLVVALDSSLWDNGAYCGKEIAITVNGKTVDAKIVDECPGCPYAGLDLTEGLFEQFADTSVGVLTGSWDFV